MQSHIFFWAGDLEFFCLLGFRGISTHLVVLYFYLLYVPKSCITHQQYNLTSVFACKKIVLYRLTLGWNDIEVPWWLLKHVKKLVWCMIRQAYGTFVKLYGSSVYTILQEFLPNISIGHNMEMIQYKMCTVTVSE